MKKNLSHSKENFFLKKSRNRVIIANITPSIDCGRYAAKCSIAEEFKVECDLLADGHDLVTGILKFRHEDEALSQTIPLNFLENDRWFALFLPEKLGNYIYSIEAWFDEFTTWQKDLKIKIEAKQVTKTDYLIGAKFLKEMSTDLDEETKTIFLPYISDLEQQENLFTLQNTGISTKLNQLVKQYYQPSFKTNSSHFNLTVDRTLANFSTWYELFPRSWSDQSHRHGSFKTLTAQLKYIKEMNFDIIYLPPIHPIGYTKRKGKNNTLQAKPDDLGSPWAIGSEMGGHTAIHPALGSVEEFKEFNKQVNNLGMEIALDFALQCSPDHPYLKSHPEWFKQRPDGTLQYAENPPKKYEDIYPFYFGSSNWYGLWEECKAILLYWINLGIKIFRVDNPHTKPFIFWEWLIREIKKTYPEVIFLSEAFTRPKIMYELAKLGFTQSYTYFTWRNTKTELMEYFQELTSAPICYFFRANLWPNTPDILHAYLQQGDKPAFIIRFLLAATLGNNYGIYGPAFELCVNEAREKNSEEYFNSEKYEIKLWNLGGNNSLKPLISKVNQLRKSYLPFQNFFSLQFHKTDNPEIICYSKSSKDFKEIILIVINLDYKYEQSGWIQFGLNNITLKKEFELTDLLTDEKYYWQGQHHFVKLDPKIMPGHIFLIKIDSNTTDCH